MAFQEGKKKGAYHQAGASDGDAKTPDKHVEDHHKKACAGGRLLGNFQEEEGQITRARNKGDMQTAYGKQMEPADGDREKA